VLFAKLGMMISLIIDLPTTKKCTEQENMVSETITTAETLMVKKISGAIPWTQERDGTSVNLYHHAEK